MNRNDSSNFIFIIFEATLTRMHIFYWCFWFLILIAKMNSHPKFLFFITLILNIIMLIFFEIWQKSVVTGCCVWNEYKTIKFRNYIYLENEF